jgi:uncharacterized protein (TIGR00159 family)
MINFEEFGWLNILDFVLVGFLVFRLYKLIRGTIAFNISLGILAIYFLYLVVKNLQMPILETLLGHVTGVGVLAIIIVFQQEIRKFLLLIGNKGQWNVSTIKQNIIKFKINENGSKPTEIPPIIDAIKCMSMQQTGALIVIKRKAQLEIEIQSGEKIDGELSKNLLLNLFFKNSPMHDGAVIIAENRVVAAKCLLPTTQKINVPEQFGTRHRAALGICESTDAIALTVSEENGKMSMAVDSKLYYDLTTDQIEKMLYDYLQGVF